MSSMMSSSRAAGRSEGTRAIPIDGQLKTLPAYRLLDEIDIPLQ